jgi:hypothetical protein
MYIYTAFRLSVCHEGIMLKYGDIMYTYFMDSPIYRTTQVRGMQRHPKSIWWRQIQMGFQNICNIA